MAKITNRFVHFKTKASFTSRLGAGDIQESSVVFIQDANEIWTHGTYYKCTSKWDFERVATDTAYATLCKNNVSVGDAFTTDGTDFIVTEVMPLGEMIVAMAFIGSGIFIELQ